MYGNKKIKKIMQKHAFVMIILNWKSIMFLYESVS